MTEVVFDEEIVRSIVQKFRKSDEKVPSIPATLMFSELREMLNSQEVAVIDQLLAVKPQDIGFTGPFVTLDEPKSNLVKITGQKHREAGKIVEVDTQYLPETVWQAFHKMQTAIVEETNLELMVGSGYRSPACQAVVFLKWLEFHEFDLRQVSESVALPGFSQHGDPVHTALDVVNIDGSPTDENPQDFAKTAEYRWLSKNAGRFGFKLSYPPNNSDGIMFEPWHWRYVGAKA